MDIQQLKSSKILVIGDACTDIYHIGSCDRISHEAPVPILQVLYTEERSGMSLNVVENLEGLHNKVDKIINKTKIYKKRYIDKRTKQHLLRVDVGDHDLIDSIEERQIDNISFDNYDALVISDYNKGFLPIEKIKRLLRRAFLFDEEYPVFVDSKKRDLSVFENCFLKINEFEYSKAEKLPNSSQIIITLGKGGALWHNTNKRFLAKETKVFDICGAGDTFLASLATSYLSFNNLEKSIKFANLCASIAVGHFGIYAVTIEDLKEHQKEEGGTF